MECIEAREYLSEHIDGRLEKQVLKGLEEHLLSCAGCRKELSLLRALISDMGGLEPLHAPPDFLERLHERMDSGFGFSRLMRTFFMPLKIKIPLELATAAATAVLVFSIWNIQQRETEIIPFPTAQKHERVAKETGPRLLASTPLDKPSRSKPAFEDSMRSLTEKIPGKESGDISSKPTGTMKSARNGRSSKGIRLNVTSRQPKKVEPEPKADEIGSPTAENAYRLSAGLPQKTPPLLEGKTGPLELILLVKADLSGKAPAPFKALKTSAPTKSVGSMDEQRVPVTSLPKKEIAREQSSPEAMRTGEPAEERQQRTPSFKKPSPLKDASDSQPSPFDETCLTVKEVVRLFNGKILSLEYDKETGQPCSLKALIPTKDYPSFCKKLEQVTLFQTPPPTLPKENREFVPVRILFISQ